MQQFVGSDRRGELSETCRVPRCAALQSDLGAHHDCHDDDPLRDERTEECPAPGESPRGGEESDGEERRGRENSTMYAKK